MSGSIAEFALNWFLYFTTTSFIGWILESAYKSVKERRLVNSGFLSGPFVPIYGFGALTLALFARILESAPDGVAWIILGLTPTAIEYAASYILEKAFRLRLWDYSTEPFNLRGRVCLMFALIWVALTAFTVLFVEPYLLERIANVDLYARFFLSGAFSMYFVMDTIGSSRSFINFKAFVVEFKELVERGGAFLPQFEVASKRLPREIRRLMKPLKSFPLLSGELKPMLHAVPDWIIARLESKIGGRHFRK